ncbi:MAG: ribosome-associated translation inhibitor RaiA [Actinomycetota bacterium]|nr:ribosome-associated translation inhibitor RaiA [Actinomycetota bacterium]
MDVVVRGRRDRVGEQDRARLERKLSRLSRLDGRIDRVEVEVTFETRGRIGGGHRVEASCRSGRRVFRASATGPDVEAAVDRLTARLERQIVEDHRRRRNRLSGGRDRVQSART